MDFPVPALRRGSKRTQWPNVRIEAARS